MRRQQQAAGAAAPELVWLRYAVPARWPEWAPFIFGVEASAPTLVPGLTGVVTGPAGLRARFAVDGVDAADPAARRWTWTVRSGPAVLTLGHEVIARPGGGTVATLTIEGAAAVVLAYQGPAAIALRRLVAP